MSTVNQQLQNSEEIDPTNRTILAGPIIAASRTPPCCLQDGVGVSQSQQASFSKPSKMCRHDLYFDLDNRFPEKQTLAALGGGEGTYEFHMGLRPTHGDVYLGS